MLVETLSWQVAAKWRNLYLGPQELSDGILSLCMMETKVFFLLFFVCLFVSCFVVVVCFLRQGFSVQPWLFWNSLCRPGWPITQKFACLCLPSAGIKGFTIMPGWYCKLYMPRSGECQGQEGRGWGGEQGGGRLQGTLGIAFEMYIKKVSKKKRKKKTTCS